MLVHERNLAERADWSQKIVNALVKAQIWTRANRAETAKLLSKEGANKYTPHSVEVLTKVLAPEKTDVAQYVASGAILHEDWHAQRIDFQPYPYQSYTEELVKLLKKTLVEGEKGFLEALDPAFAAKDLVDDRFVKKAIAANGGLAAFGLPEQFERKEVIAT